VKKLLPLLAAGVLAFLAVRWVARGLASDEARIRQRLEHMASAFDETRLGPIADGLARDFADRHSGLDRAYLLDALRALFVEHATGEFPYRVRLEELEVEVADPGAREPTAVASLLARFEDVSGAAPRTVWAITIEADLVERDGWQVQSSEYVSAEGEWRGLR